MLDQELFVVSNYGTIDQEFEKYFNRLLKVDEDLAQDKFVKFARPNATQDIVGLIINKLDRN